MAQSPFWSLQGCVLQENRMWWLILTWKCFFSCFWDSTSLGSGESLFLVQALTGFSEGLLDPFLINQGENEWWLLSKNRRY